MPCLVIGCKIVIVQKFAAKTGNRHKIAAKLDKCKIVNNFAFCSSISRSITFCVFEILPQIFIVSLMAWYLQHK